jgi:hypothetical protein
MRLKGLNVSEQTDTDRPAPPVPEDCDLRDFAFMPLDVRRLRDSGLAGSATGDEFRAAVLLWCAAWHQVPASSLPNDDAQLAMLAGYGRDSAGWLSVRAGALRGFIEATDNRLYHPVIAEKAHESHMRRRRQSEGGSKAMARRWGKGKKKAPDKVVIPGLQQGQGQGQGQGHRQGERDSSVCTDTGVARSVPTTPMRRTDSIAWTPETNWQGISETDRAAWATAYPACDLDAQLERANQWLLANPAKAKKSAWRRFITTWLGRAQERGGDAPANKTLAMPSRESWMSKLGTGGL